MPRTRNKEVWRRYEFASCSSFGSSNVEGFKVGDALLSEFPVLFDEVVFDTADFGGGKGFLPVDAAFAHAHLRVALALGTLCSRSWGLHVYVLKMNREEAARML